MGGKNRDEGEEMGGKDLHTMQGSARPALFSLSFSSGPFFLSFIEH